MSVSPGSLGNSGVFLHSASASPRPAKSHVSRGEAGVSEASSVSTAASQRVMRRPSDALQSLRMPIEAEESRRIAMRDASGLGDSIRRTGARSHAATSRKAASRSVSSSALRGVEIVAACARKAATASPARASVAVAMHHAGIIGAKSISYITSLFSDSYDNIRRNAPSRRIRVSATNSIWDATISSTDISSALLWSRNRLALEPIE